jgi:hypothetical protein
MPVTDHPDDHSPLPYGALTNRGPAHDAVRFASAACLIVSAIFILMASSQWVLSVTPGAPSAAPAPEEVTGSRAGYGDGATISWGGVTNHIRAGLLYEGSRDQASFSPSTVFAPAFESLWSKEALYWFPPETECYVVSLRDDDGKQVERTSKGLEQGRPIDTNPLLSRSEGKYRPRGFNPSAGPSFFLQVFKPSDFFVISKPGTYTLEWQMRVLFQDSATNKQTILLPPVSLNIVVEKPGQPGQP